METGGYERNEDVMPLGQITDRIIKPDARGLRIKAYDYINVREPILLNLGINRYGRGLQLGMILRADESDLTETATPQDIIEYQVFSRTLTQKTRHRDLLSQHMSRRARILNTGLFFFLQPPLVKTSLVFQQRTKNRSTLFKMKHGWKHS